YSGDKSYLAQSYGDSFTYGAEVDDPDTWQAQFEGMTGKGILNFGSGGYGLDQAVLKFEKYGPQYPTPFVILGLYPHEYRRILSYQSFYYFTERTFRYAFKPIFIPAAEGYELVKPPCDNPESLVEVVRHRPEKLERFLSAHDYWYQANA